MNEALFNLKLVLQSHGALQPEAWEMIVDFIQEMSIELHQSHVYQTASILFLRNGLLKEYAINTEGNLGIVDFIGPYQFVIVKQPMGLHVTAIQESHLYYCDRITLFRIYNAFPELLSIYDRISGSYEAQRQFRMWLLERNVKDRIAAFKLKMKAHLPYLKKKDIADYLHINYTNLLANF